MLRAMRRASCALLALALVAGGATLAARTARQSSLTADEPKHVITGLYQLATGRCCLGGDNNPSLALNALLLQSGEHPGREHVRPAPDAWQSGRAFLLAEPDLDAALLRARLPSIALWIGTALLVFAWSRSLYGAGGALLSLGLFAFDPLLLGHGSLATGDVHAAFFMTLASFAWARHHERPGARRLAAAGVCLGLALAAKFSALALLPAFAALAALSAARSGGGARALARAGAELAGALALAALVLFLAYGATLSRDPVYPVEGGGPFPPGFADR
jgi:hypothetical protein